MNKSIAVNESSIVDLKAELFRKEETFKKKKSSGFSDQSQSKPAKGSKTLEKLAALTGKRKNTNKINESETKKIPINSNNDEEQFQRAKLSLQSKAEMYEKMRTGELEDVEEEGGESMYLVDFLKKSSNENLLKSASGIESPEEEWVEFEDSLGRQRKCLKKDLNKFRAADPVFRPVEENESTSVIELEDAHREMMKNKWEQEQDEMNRNPQTDVHYQNVRFDEVRELGVGYYQFSKEESERHSQMESLNILRKQTIEQRAKRERMKEKRQLVLNARLAKVREKKLKKQHLVSQETGEYPEIEKDAGSHACETINEAVFVRESTEEFLVDKSDATLTADLQDPVKKLPSTDQFSIGVPQRYSVKPQATASSAGWINSLREERNPDFAPPCIYNQPPHEKRGIKDPWKH